MDRKVKRVLYGDSIHLGGMLGAVVCCVANAGQGAEVKKNAGPWATAALCYEYLVAEGLSTATPYGMIPSQADICRYRAAADARRAKERQ